MTDLEGLGWGPSFAEAFRDHAREGWSPGRVALAERGVYRVWTARGELRAGLAGHLRHHAAGAADLPAVGDWVALRAGAGDHAAAIHAVLPRRSAFSRKLAGSPTEEQVVAANVDTLFLVSGLDRDFNPRRIERSLVLAWESGALPVLLLNKADACADPWARAETACAAAPGVPVHPVSARTGAGLDALDGYLGRGRTVALLGSSGAGKSTLVNRLLGRELQATREVRARDGRGQHATTRRELILLPGGALLVDTPGWRELQLWAAGAGLDQAFEDVAALAARCRFRDCAHGQEPGCAVREGLGDDRLRSYRKLQGELRALAGRQDERARAAEKGRLRSIHKLANRFRPRG
jgi:ribosome biogenesis GTPase / thiamine phosphate phosphatase